MEHPDTVADAMRLLEADGYRADFSVAHDTVRCGRCQVAHAPDRLTVRHTFRFEGASDPGDEAIVMGVECPECHARGIIVSAYGPDADPELIELVARLQG